MSLLESVIGALASQARGGSAAPEAGLGGGLGGLGDLIGAVTGGGGAGGAAQGGGAALIAGLIGALLSGQGGAGGGGGGLGAGLPGLLEQLQRGGLGAAASSWVGTGENLPVSPSQLENAIGPDVLANLARQFGLAPSEAASHLSEVLPGVVDRLTPNGRLPDGDFSDIGSLLGRLGGGR